MAEKEVKKWSFSTIAPTDGLANVPDDAKGMWKKGLCECFSSFGICCTVFWCNPCTTGQMASIARGGSAMLCLLITFGIIVLNVVGDSLEIASRDNAAMYAAGSLLIFLSSIITCVAVWHTRAKMRERDQIRGSVLFDCLIATFCSPCATCQHSNQEELVACGGDGTAYKGIWSTYATAV